MKEELKTLKELTINVWAELAIEEIGKHGFDSMELVSSPHELREEAKKWIAKIETKIKEKEGQYDDFGIDLGMAYAESGEAIIGFIKHFFNLEDKNG